MLHWQQDPFGNFVARVDFQESIKDLSVEVEFIAGPIPINPLGFLLDAHAAYFPFEYEPQQSKDLSPYLETSEQVPQMRRWLNELDCSKQGIMDFLVRLNQLVHQHVSYTIRLQPGVQSSEESLELTLGSCRDSAWLLVQAMRHLG